MAIYAFYYSFLIYIMLLIKKIITGCSEYSILSPFLTSYLFPAFIHPNNPIRLPNPLILRIRLYGLHKTVA